MSNDKCDIGLAGLGVMGKNFALNMADKGFRVGVFNRTEEKTRKFMEDEVDHRPVEAGYTLEEFAGLLKKPRAALIFVPAGDPVDQVMGWRIDQEALGAIDSILARNIADPVGPEFMAPPARGQG